ncbi:hypothetical protein GH714_042211 [Hevea brasiliensis]|uniref:Uncharacterized protein n=1 Tax=Hevea brasiliensis TaxID=3981 RepID=A0A6A6MTH9_HEVBR|nr:hypothetical protein GH714_042211 [Hevea brasiliensis]
MMEVDCTEQDIRKMIFEEAIRKTKKIMEGHPETKFTTEEYQRLMARWLCRFFEYLDRYFIPEYMTLGSLNEISINCFRDLINQERMGLYIDRDALKNALLSSWKSMNIKE